MDVLILVSRLLLAAVMAVAGFAKLADLTGSRQAMLGFGVPARLAPALGLLLPIAEIVVAVLLLFAPVAWWGSVLALLLLLAFIAGISANLARGRKPDCHCFGQLHSEPIGWPTLVRNGILALVATWLVWQGPERLSAAGGVNALAGTQAITWIALTVGVVALALAALEGWFLLHLLQQNGRLLLRIEALETRTGATIPALSLDGNAKGLPIGSAAPTFSLAGLHGETLTLDSLRVAQKPLLLVFIEPQCGSCNSLLPELARWQREHASRLLVVPITRASAEANKATEHGLQYLLLQKEFEVGQSYQAKATPSAVLVRPNGTVGSPLAEGAEEIRSLLRAAVANPDSALPVPAVIPLANRNGDGNAHANGYGNGSRTILPMTAKRGDVAPEMRLPDLNDNLLDFASFKGHPLLILFWNPGCGYCRQMVDDLKAWEADPPQGAPKLLLVSTGTAEANQAMGLQSQIVLDTGFTTARAFGAQGTPSAVLVDEEGRIASEVAAGRDAVLVLARGMQSVAQQIAR